MLFENFIISYPGLPKVIDTVFRTMFSSHNVPLERCFQICEDVSFKKGFGHRPIRGMFKKDRQFISPADGIVFNSVAPSFKDGWCQFLPHKNSKVELRGSELFTDLYKALVPIDKAVYRYSRRELNLWEDEELERAIKEATEEMMATSCEVIDLKAEHLEQLQKLISKCPKNSSGLNQLISKIDNPR